MKRSPSAFCLAFLLVSIGCGGRTTSITPSGSPPPPSPQYVSPDESWHFTAESSNSQPPQIEAALSFQDSKVNGVTYAMVNASQGTCSYYSLPLQISGTVDSTNNIHLVTFPVPVTGTTLTIDASLSQDRLSIVDGTYKITGGCGDGYAGSISGVKVNPLNGRYSGTLTLGQVTIPVTAELTQSKLANSVTGYFGIAGTVTTIGSACAQTFVLDGSQVIGNYVSFYSITGTGLEALTGRVNPSGQQIALNDYVYSDDCTAGYNGLLQHQ
jgi:hypothetical protein